MTNSTQYLYDIEPTILTDMNYKEALEYKKVSASELYSRLYLGNEDFDRQHFVWKAMIHTQKLLTELEN